MSFLLINLNTCNYRFAMMMLHYINFKYDIELQTTVIIKDFCMFFSMLTTNKKKLVS